MGLRSLSLFAPLLHGSSTMETQQWEEFHTAVLWQECFPWLFWQAGPDVEVRSEYECERRQYGSKPSHQRLLAARLVARQLEARLQNRLEAPLEART